MADSKRIQPMEMTNIITTDLIGITRGRSVPTKTLDEYWTNGCSWVPAVSAITPQHIVATPNPWGCCNDLRIIPDGNSRVQIQNGPDPNAPPLDFIHGDLIETDGTPWSACPRTLLRQEIDRYRDLLCLKVFGAYEHEFILSPTKSSSDLAPLSLQALRDASDFAGWLMAAFEAGNLEPEMFMSEAGRHQYEVTCRPNYGVGIADRAVNVHEITHEIARQMNRSVSFAPKPALDSFGSGLHLHLSLQNLNNQPVLYDVNRRFNLSEVGEYWSAGIIHHLPALFAICAPTPASYLRLKPNSFSAPNACLGYRIRETALRICPVVTLGNKSIAEQYNLEFRTLDATASPHLALAAILIAGRLGIQQKRKLTAAVDVDPTEFTAAEREKYGIVTLPSSLSAALENLQNDKELLQVLPKPLVDNYFAVKKQELVSTSSLDDATICENYARYY